MISVVPVTDVYKELSIWCRVREGDDDPIIDLEATKATSRLEESGAGKVEVGSDLILYLECIRKIVPRKDWAIRAKNTILPTRPTLPDSIPIYTGNTNRLSPCSFSCTWVFYVLLIPRAMLLLF